MRIALTLCVLAFSGRFAMGDTVLENGSSPTFSSMPSSLSTGLNSGVPYWNNYSGDFGGSNTADVGYFLEAAGFFSGGTNYNPNGYLSQGGSPNSAPNFNLVRNTNAVLLTLLGTNTGGTDVFGIYDATKTTALTAAATEIPLFTSSTSPGITANESAAAYPSYGFYVTNLGNTWFSNTALDANDGAHQHFALFTLASDANVFYLGVTDWFYGNGGDGNGDYQDLVIRISSDPAPEPATLALMGAGLIGLGLTRFCSRKKRA
jgi:hypothetical protein